MAMPGGFTDVPNGKNGRFDEIAKWAVCEYNKKQGKHLTFVKVVLGKELLFGTEIRYYISLVAKDGSHNNLYATTILESVVTHVKVLEEFKLVFEGDENLPDPKKKQEVGQWAVNEYNKEKPANLTFVIVVLGKEKADLAGTWYYLALIAKDGAICNLYSATVFELAKIKVRELIEFKPIVPVVPDAPFETTCA